MISIDPKLQAGTWFTHPDEKTLQFKIRPTSIYSIKKAPGEVLDITLPDVVDMYLYCLMDWKGVGGPDDEELKCNEETKLTFLNQQDQYIAFIITKAGEMKKDIAEAQEVKNSLKSQPGETQKKDKPVATIA